MAAAGGPIATRLGELQLLLREVGLEGWLLTDHRGQSPIARRAIGLGAHDPMHRFFFWVPAGDGMPALVAHVTEIDGFPELPGDQLSYASFAELRGRLEKLVPTRGKVAMEHVELGGAPDLARVDWGTIALVRSGGCEVVSSLELVNAFLGPWSPGDVALHARAHRMLVAARELAVHAVEAERGLTEHALLGTLRGALLRGGVTGPLPSVAVGDRTTSRLAGVTLEDRVIGRGTLICADLTGRVEHGPFAHVALLVSRGEPGARVGAMFERARTARERAVASLTERFERGVRTLGYEIDREIALELGRGKDGVRARHRGGHHLGWIAWSGEACTFDDTEIHDPREALVGHAWSIHPGVYEADVGVRAQASVRRTEHGLEVLDPGQAEILVVG